MNTLGEEKATYLNVETDGACGNVILRLEDIEDGVLLNSIWKVLFAPKET